MDKEKAVEAAKAFIRQAPNEQCNVASVAVLMADFATAFALSQTAEDKAEIERLTAKLAAAEKALKEIAKPALGGKLQQYRAAEALKEITNG